MTSTKALRVSIGPVQEFISSGRRTRDYWAGSFLLSWLSGVAMKAVKDQGGTITVPAVQGPDGFTEPTLRALEKGSSNGVCPGPLVGSLVNHFRAEVPEDFEFEGVETAVRVKFKELADQVYEIFIRPALTSDNKEAVKVRWDDQINGSYFEILAVMGVASDWREEAVWLERRKMLRTHLPFLAESGADRCPVHGDMSELGGFSGQYDRDSQAAFWQRIRKVVRMRMYEDGGAGATKWTECKSVDLERELVAEESEDSKVFSDTLEIRKSEHLSGMALVKRLFPLLEPKRIAMVIGWMPDHMYNICTSDEQWDPQEAQYALRNWPSTSFIAAIPWIVKAGGANVDATELYAENQFNTLGVCPIWHAERPQHHRVLGIDKLAAKMGELPKFATLDGTLHFERGLEKQRYQSDQIAKDLQKEFRILLDNLKGSTVAEQIKGGPASTHYAMLEMDGDRVGAVFSCDQDRAICGSKALLKFSAEVPKIIRDHDGILIYAGADDVNAMLPIETAIDCAVEINALWTRIIEAHLSELGDKCPTLSGSIVFADYQNALDDVRRLTHERLEKVAKDGMGRDALALAVMKSGGITASWASCWRDDAGESPVLSLLRFARAAAEKKTIASRLAYVARARFGEILSADDLFDDKQLEKLFTKEMSDGRLSGVGETDAEKAAAIVAVLRPFYRPEGSLYPQRAPRHIGGLLIARFLAQNFMWSYFDEWKTCE